MAGAFTVTVKIDDREIMDALTRLSRKAGRMGTAYNNIGEALLESLPKRVGGLRGRRG